MRLWPFVNGENIKCRTIFNLEKSIIIINYFNIESTGNLLKLHTIYFCKFKDISKSYLTRSDNIFYEYKIWSTDLTFFLLFVIIKSYFCH